MNHRTKVALKIFGTFVALIIVIIVSASFWNMVAVGSTAIVGTFEVVLSVINFLLEMAALIYIGRKLIFDN